MKGSADSLLIALDLNKYKIKIFSQGALTGLALGLAFAMVLGFGQPKPVPPTLDFSIEECDPFGGFPGDGGRFFNSTVAMSSAAVKAVDTEYVFKDLKINISMILLRSILCLDISGCLNCPICGTELWAIS